VNIQVEFWIVMPCSGRIPQFTQFLFLRQ